MTDKLRKAVQAALWLLDHGDSVSPDKPTHKALRAALAEPESEPVKIPHVHQWVTTGAMKHGQFRCIYCGAWGEEDRPSSSERTYTRAEVEAMVPAMWVRDSARSEWADGWNNCRFEMLSRLDAAPSAEGEA